MLIDEQEVKTRIQAATHELRRDLQHAHEQREAAEYRARVAEWAVVGIVRSRAAVQYQLDAAALVTQAQHLYSSLLDTVANNCARHLLHQSRLEFNDHAELHRALSHIHYLENHARSRGVEFKPWSPPITAQGLSKTPDKWHWPTNFVGPYEA